MIMQIMKREVYSFSIVILHKKHHSLESGHINLTPKCIYIHEDTQNTEQASCMQNWFNSRVSLVFYRKL